MIMKAHHPTGCTCELCEVSVLRDSMQLSLRSVFVGAFNELAKQAHENAVAKGFWDHDGGDAQFIALCHAELSEALEALRHGNKHDDHIPQFSGVEAELADVVIRIMDRIAARGWKVAEAVIAKMEYNKGREQMHGGKKF